MSILKSILSGAGKVANVAGGAALANLKNLSWEKMPGKIFNAAGGNKVPLLNSAFNAFMNSKGIKPQSGTIKPTKSSNDAAAKKKEKADAAAQKKQEKAQIAAANGEKVKEKHQKGHDAAMAGMQKEQNNLIQRMSDDIHEIKGVISVLAKNAGQGSGNNQGGGILGMFGGLLGNLVGLIPGKGMLARAGGALRGMAGRVGAFGGRLLDKTKGLFNSAKTGIAGGFSGIASRAGSVKDSVLAMGKAGLSRAGGLIESGKSALSGVVDLGKKHAGKILGTLGIGAGGTALASEIVDVAGKEGSSALAKGTAKGGLDVLAKTGVKTVGKSILKKVPIVSILAGLGFAGHRAYKGDWAGAGMELASGVVGTLPGLGTAGSIAIDVALAKRDYDKEIAALEKGPEGAVTKPTGTYNADADVQWIEGTPKPKVSAPAPRMESALSTQPTESVSNTLSGILSTMLSLMTDEKKGIFVRKASDTLSEPLSFSTTNGGTISRIPVKPSSDEFSGIPIRNTSGITTRIPGNQEMAPLVVRSESRGINRVPSNVSTGGPLGSSKDDMALGVYDAARRAGFSHSGARVLVGEIGRENSLNSKLIFGSHDDPANRARNAGMISWQGSRKDDLMKFLGGVPGALDEQGNMTKTQANLDGQMAFLRQEMESGRIGRRTSGMAEMLSSDNVDQRAMADAVGRDFIKWRIDDPKYRDKGIANREAFAGKLDNALASRNTGSIAPIVSSGNQEGPFATVTSELFRDTQAAIDKHVGYQMGAKNTRSGVIDCSGWITQINRGLIKDISEQGEKMSGTKEAEKLFEGGAAEIVGNIANVTGKVFGNSELTTETLKEGMIIGENNGTGKGRGKMGIDHVTQVVRDPSTGELKISQSSSSGGGVTLEKVHKYLDRKNANGTKLFGVDSTAALDSLTGGQYSERANALATTGPRYAEAIGQSTNEADEAQRNSKLPPPIFIDASTQSSGKPMTGNQPGSGLTAPMGTRNNDTSIRRLTDNHMYSSSPW